MQLKDNNLQKYGQYTRDLFNKLDFNFVAGRRILDVGCGPCTDVEIFINEYGLDVYGLDIHKHENVAKIPKLKFVEAGILHIPFVDNFFDYVFLHDVLHHVDEKNQDYATHVAAMRELNRVVKDGGKIIIIEGNRYNPLFYPHMVKMLGHNHWRQSYFKRVVGGVFDNVEFKYFESHLYPAKFLWFWKCYEKIMEHWAPKNFLAYNVAIITK